MASFRADDQGLAVQIKVDGSRRAFKHFWATTVEGFDAAHHCIRCLVGKRLRSVKPELGNSGGEVELRLPPGTIMYVCGVDTAYRRDRNVHLPVRVELGASMTHSLGDKTIRIQNARRLEFNNRAAVELFPDLGPEFLTCRNFQVAAQLMRAGDIPLVRGSAGPTRPVSVQSAAASPG